MAAVSDSCGSIPFEWVARRRVLIRNGSNGWFALERYSVHYRPLYSVANEQPTRR
ncbi:hypothetical protein K443DRAFT_675155 [Laccaria amethystina LaAM-08-1]|uniref:Uncharacterized protein n=1 Tax=Laccaria amethystina LaAM-08-1 TaxID=1095629 RepID=A0A0C9X0K1_9AGAR|nr:hypothetical protein K443DRAFT_675155 [Laccaria amethystina LaAM-08-1]